MHPRAGRQVGGFSDLSGRRLGGGETAEDAGGDIVSRLRLDVPENVSALSAYEATVPRFSTLCPLWFNRVFVDRDKVAHRGG